MEINSKFLALFLGVVLVIAAFSAMATGFDDNQQTEIVMVSLEGENDVTGIASAGGEILQEYPDRALVEIPSNGEAALSSNGVDIVNPLPARTELSVKGHRFDINEGPDFSDDLTIESYDSGEKRLYLVHMIGPVHAEWREDLENMGIDILNYVPNYAYEVMMSPEKADQVEALDFVDWTDTYQPGFKLAQDLEPGKVKIEMVDGSKLIKEVKHESKFPKIAQREHVYYISNYEEPQLMSEVGSQIIGGGVWVYDDDDDPTTPYRAEGNYGAYANQLGYDGSGVVTAIADTGLGDGTTPNAGHNDFTGRVIGGYGFGTASDWGDGHGHGTHCAGLMTGDTYDGNGVEYAGHGPYYVGQGLSSDSDIYGQKIFADDGSSLIPSNSYEVPEEAKQSAGAYVHSNSWGSSSGGAYGDSDNSYDKAARDADSSASGNQPMVLVIAAGNDGDGTNTIGSPGNGKNVITVGASKSYMPDSTTYGNDGSDVSNPDDIASFSSRGWTDDNRVKPTVSAPGQGTLSTSTPELSSSNLYGLYSEDSRYEWCSGTSQATPTVSGAVSVVVDYYESTYGTKPSPAMVKSLIINTAYDMDDANGNTGPVPNKDEGWGLVNLVPIVDPPVSVKKEDQTSLLTTGDTDSYNIQYDKSNHPMNITLTWTDDEAASGADPTLINDLNLRVTAPDGSTVYKGNAFDGDGDGVSDNGFTQPGADAMGDFDGSGDGWDNRNVVEVVKIPSSDLQSGQYTVEVIGENIPNDSNNDGTANQDYALTMYNAATVTSNGTINIQEDKYSLEDTVNITVQDADLTGSGSIDINVDSDTETSGETVTLTETSDGVFEGTEEISATDSSGVLHVSDGDTITAYYTDSDTGDGTSETKTDTAIVDGSVASPSDLTVEWDGISKETPINEGFESGLSSNWSHAPWDYRYGNTNDNWAVGSPSGTGAPSSAHSGSNVAAINPTSSYVADEGSYLETPAVDIPSDAQNATFSFWMYTDIESSYDGINLKLSQNGSTYQNVTASLGYDGSVDTGYSNPLAGENAWWGQKSWTNVTFDLSSYTGSNVQFRWHWGSDSSVTNWGPAVDDVLLKYESSGSSTEDNLLNWTLSPDDGAGENDVVQYNIYRSDSESGPWDDSNYLTSVSAGTNSYRDLDKGEPDGINWWYVVRAEDDVGNEDSNTNAVPENTTSDNTAPNAPTNPSPADGATGVSTDPTLSVDVSDPDGDEMTVTFYNASDDSQIGQNTGVTNGTTSVTWSGLSYSTTYSWYAVADDGNASTQSSTWSFTTQAEPNSAPNAPTNPSPADGATGVSTSPTLSVDVSDPDGDSMTVTFYNASDDSQIGQNTGVTNGTTSVTWSGLSYSTTYDWYTVADDGQTSTQSSTWSFTTQSEPNNPPNTPTNPSPADGATGVSTSPTLSVDVSDPDGDSMTVTFYNASDDSQIGQNTGVTNGTTSVTWSGLSYGTTYSWYTVADDGSASTTSNTWSFTTQTQNYNLTIDSTSGGNVTVPGEGTFTYSSGEEVSLEAVADSGYHFVEWTGDNGTIADVTANQTTITMDGDYVITANFEATQVDNVEITPGSDQVVTAGDELIFDASAYDTNGNLITDDRIDFTWQSATRGVFNRRKVGDYDVTATYDGVTSNITTITVDPDSADRIEITPQEKTATAGGVVSYSATAYDAYENEIGDVSGSTTWSIDSGANGTWSGSDYNTEVAGDWTVTGDYNGLTDSAMLTVEPGTVDTVELTPSADQTITSGEQIEFSAAAYDAYGNLIADNVEAFTWENATRGIFYYETTGQYDVTATYNGVSSQPTTVTVQEDSTNSDVGSTGMQSVEQDVFELETTSDTEVKRAVDKTETITKPLSSYSIF